MNEDYYKILEVEKTASQDEIKKAYRKMARLYHPDLAGKHNEEKFKEINEAYQVLSDPQKRARYDQFGKAGANANNGFSGYGGGFNGAEGFDFNDIFSGGRSGGLGFSGFGDIFEDLFSNAFSQVQVELAISLTQAILGDKIQFKNQDNDIIDLVIPANVQDGTTFRIRGKGNQTKRGRGDLLVTIRIKYPRHLTREQRELFEKLKQTGI